MAENLVNKIVRYIQFLEKNGYVVKQARLKSKSKKKGA